MKQTQPLRLNYEFARVYHKGRYMAGRHVVLHYLRRQGTGNRLGVTASRKIKGSVRRNRIKRLLRESYRQFENSIPAGYDMILVGRESTAIPDFLTVRQEVGQLLKKAGLAREERRNDPSPDHTEG